MGLITFTALPYPLPGSAAEVLKTLAEDVALARKNRVVELAEKNTEEARCVMERYEARLRRDLGVEVVRPEF